MPPGSLQGLNITVTLYHRHQQGDDEVGGSVQTRDPVAVNIPARIGPTRTPYILRVQGIESSDMFDCTIAGYDPLTYQSVKIMLDDILVPDAGQYQGIDFVILGTQEDSVAENPNDFRKHKNLSLRRWVEARTIQ